MVRVRVEGWTKPYKVLGINATPRLLIAVYPCSSTRNKKSAKNKKKEKEKEKWKRKEGIL